MIEILASRYFFNDTEQICIKERKGTSGRKSIRSAARDIFCLNIMTF